MQRNMKIECVKTLTLILTPTLNADTGTPGYASIFLDSDTASMEKSVHTATLQKIRGGS